MLKKLIYAAACAERVRPAFLLISNHCYISCVEVENNVFEPTSYYRGCYQASQKVSDCYLSQQVGGSGNLTPVNEHQVSNHVPIGNNSVGRGDQMLSGGWRGWSVVVLQLFKVITKNKSCKIKRKSTFIVLRLKVRRYFNDNQKH